VEAVAHLGIEVHTIIIRRSADVGADDLAGRHLDVDAIGSPIGRHESLFAVFEDNAKGVTLRLDKLLGFRDASADQDSEVDGIDNSSATS
jgi:hypothetical protein